MAKRIKANFGYAEKSKNDRKVFFKMKKAIYEKMKARALEMYEKAHIVLTEEEKNNLEVADFGLEDVENTGLQLVIYINNEYYCAKEMVLLPGQTCPEHAHIPFEGYIGKQETFRCRYGTVYLYVEGEAAKNPHAIPPKGVYTIGREIVLQPGQQYTLMPGDKHWFQAGPEGAVISEFSTSSHDEYDVFSDPAIARIPVMED